MPLDASTSVNGSFKKSGAFEPTIWGCIARKVNVASDTRWAAFSRSITVRMSDRSLLMNDRWPRTSLSVPNGMATSNG